MTFPYKGLKSMADLWVNIDREDTIVISKFAAWVKDQPIGTKFEMLLDNDDESVHIYTR